MARSVNGSYVQHAFGHDELRPETGGFSDSEGKVGVTLVESLDTLFLMGMTREFDDACDWVRGGDKRNVQVGQNLAFESVKNASVAAFTTRVLGGLLSAYDLSQRDVLLQKAVELADLLLLAFDEEDRLPAVLSDLWRDA